jgi:hypothetical protein
MGGIDTHGIYPAIGEKILDIDVQLKVVNLNLVDYQIS